MGIIMVRVMARVRVWVGARIKVDTRFMWLVLSHGM